MKVMLPDDMFRDRTILITGGGTGLGRSMAEMLLRLGGQVAICGRREEVLEQTAAELQEATGGRVVWKGCDIREPEQVEALCDHVIAECGDIHALVNNAAGNFICPTEHLSYNAFHTVVDIVLRGTANCSLAVGKRWIGQQQNFGGQRSMLSIVTPYAWTGSAFVVPSATAKGGVLALTRSLAAEWGRHGIRNNAIAPGPFPTEGAWSRLIPPQVEPLLDPAKTVPLQRVGEHEELANLAAFLLSDFAGYINGECVTIDGGQWLQGAGQFTPLLGLSQQDWLEIQAKLRPKKP